MLKIPSKKYVLEKVYFEVSEKIQRHEIDLSNFSSLLLTGKNLSASMTQVIEKAIADATASIEHFNRLAKTIERLYEEELKKERIKAS